MFCFVFFHVSPAPVFGVLGDFKFPAVQIFWNRIGDNIEILFSMNSILFFFLSVWFLLSSSALEIGIFFLSFFRFFFFNGFCF